MDNTEEKKNLSKEKTKKKKKSLLSRMHLYMKIWRILGAI